MDFIKDNIESDDENNASESEDDVDDQRQSEDEDSKQHSHSGGKVVVENLSEDETDACQWPLPTTSTTNTDSDPAFLPPGHVAAAHGARVVELRSDRTSQQIGGLNRNEEGLFNHDVQSHMADDVCEVVLETSTDNSLEGEVINPISTKLRNWYISTGVTTVAITYANGNVFISGPDHMKALNDNHEFKNIFLDTLAEHQTVERKEIVETMKEKIDGDFLDTLDEVELKDMCQRFGPKAVLNSLNEAYQKNKDDVEDKEIGKTAIIIPSWVSQRLEEDSSLDSSMRGSIVTHNCNAVWQHNQSPNKVERQRLADLICTQFQDFNKDDVFSSIDKWFKNKRHREKKLISRGKICTRSQQENHGDNTPRKKGSLKFRIDTISRDIKEDEESALSTAQITDEELKQWFVDYDKPVTPGWIQTLLLKDIPMDAAMRQELINVNCQVIWRGQQMVPPVRVKRKLAEMLCLHFPSLRQDDIYPEGAAFKSIQKWFCNKMYLFKKKQKKIDKDVNEQGQLSFVLPNRLNFLKEDVVVSDPDLINGGVKTIIIPQTVKSRLENGLLMDNNMRRQIISANCFNLWSHMNYPHKRIRRKLAMVLCEQFEDLKQLEDPPEGDAVKHINKWFVNKQYNQDRRKRKSLGDTVLENDPDMFTRKRKRKSKEYSDGDIKIPKSRVERDIDLLTKDEDELDVANDDHIEIDFSIPEWVTGGLESGVGFEKAMRVAVINANCFTLWMKTKNPSPKLKRRFAKIMCEQLPQMKQDKDPVEHKAFVSIHNWFKNRRHHESKAERGLAVLRPRRTTQKSTTLQGGKDTSDMTRKSWQLGDLELLGIEDEDFTSSKRLLDKEIRKDKPRVALVADLMSDTCLARETEIYNYSVDSRVEETIKNWPALRLTSEILNEFSRRVRREQSQFLADAKREFEILMPVIVAYVNSQQNNKLLKEITDEFQVVENPLYATTTIYSLWALQLLLAKKVKTDQDRNCLFKIKVDEDQNNTESHPSLLISLDENKQVESFTLIIRNDNICTVDNAADAIFILVAAYFVFDFNYPMQGQEMLTFFQEKIFKLHRIEEITNRKYITVTSVIQRLLSTSKLAQ